MVRLFNAYFPGRTLILSVSETLVMWLAFVAATVVFYGRDAELVLSYEGGFGKIALVTLVFLICMYYLDMYDSVILNSRREVIVRLVQVAGIGTIVLAGVYYAFPDLRLSTGIFIAGVCLLLFSLIFWRQMFFWICRSFHLVQPAIVLGGGELAMEVAREVHKRPETALDLVGYICEDNESAGMSLRRLGGMDRLSEVVRAHRIERVIVAMGDRRRKLPVEELLKLKTEGVEVQDGADVYEALTGKVPLASLRLSWLLFSTGFRVPPYLLIYKRIFSVALSALMLLVAAPVMLLVVVLIRLDSPGPALFKQKRVGKKGELFTLYKFRTMYVDQGKDHAGNHRPAEAGDPRITRMGRLLRRSRIDELPQLFNILLGDMYFVGPRPFVPDQEASCIQHIPFYAQRWAVRPGATGWAQIHRGYCATIEDNAEKLAYDLFYIKNMSIGLDLLIIFQTFKTLLLGRGGR